MTMQKSNVEISTRLMLGDASSDRERHTIIAAEVGVSSANQNLSEILNVREICNFKKTNEGYIPGDKDFVYLSQYESRIETYETNLFVSIRKGIEITTNASPKTQLSSNTLYILTHGSMNISYEDGENITISPFVGNNWSSEYPNFRYSTNCAVELSKNSSLFIIDLINPVSSYDIEHIRFNGMVDRHLDSDTTVVVKRINTDTNNNQIYINDEICNSDLVCNGNISLNSSGNALSILLKNKE